VRDQDQTPTTVASSLADGGATVDSSHGYFIEIGETALELGPPNAVPDEGPLTTLEKPTETAEGTILARPTVDAVSPVGVRWSGSATRKKDWMTSLTPFASGDEDDGLAAIDQPGATLASLVDHLMEAASPVAFQVVFQRRTSWQSDAEIRKEDPSTDGTPSSRRSLAPSWRSKISGAITTRNSSASQSPSASSISTRRTPSGRSLPTLEQSAFQQGMKVATTSRPR